MDKKTTTKKSGRKPAKKKPAATAAAKIKKTATERPAAEKPAVKSEKPLYSVGKRKTSVSQILMSTGNGKVMINELPFEKYFETRELMHVVKQPLTAIGVEKNVDIKAKIHGGGIHSQAESLRHAIAKALIVRDPESRRTLKKLGFLTRDSRIKERKKPGLKRARRAPQFSKR
jgi:small subunit ribosomal protein S9